MKEEQGLIRASFYSSKPLYHVSSSWAKRPSSLAGCAIAALALIIFLFLLSPLQQPAVLLFPIADKYTIAAHSTNRSGTLNQPNTVPSPGLSSCEVWRGEWVPNASPPPYTNHTCPYIQPNQNCLYNGRPDRGYLHWKWRPFDCNLPPFNASLFLDSMRGKRFAFIGDSLAGNQMTSLLCMLAQVENPHFIAVRLSEYTMCLFPSHNFTLTHVWSPFLVNYTVEHHNNSVRDDVYTLHLDALQEVWMKQLAEHDVAIVSTGYWYHRKSLYYVNNTLVGGSLDSGHDHGKTIDLLSVMRTVLAKVLMHMTMDYQGITMLRTVTVDHFEHGWWYDGGACDRTSPFSQQSGDEAIPPIPRENDEINKMQIEEFEKAVAYAKDPSKLKLLNVTYSAHLRPDAHPGKYRGRVPKDPPYDCLHWCLPGAIDMWNQFLVHILHTAFDR